MESAPKRTVSPWIKAIVIFHLAMITLWSLPDPPKSVTERGQNPVGTDWLLAWNNKFVKQSPLAYYLVSTGIWQYWDMFAPNPSAWDGYVDAELTYKDGSTGVFQYTRVKNLGTSQAYLKERYRKFLERAHQEQYAYIWPYFAQRVALEATKSLENPVVQVRLRRHWRLIQPPGEPQWPDYRSYTYFPYAVDQEKLRKDFRS